MAEVTPRPTSNPEPTPEGTPAHDTTDCPPEEKVFDISGGHIVMETSGGNRVAINGEELEEIGEGLKALCFELREQCTIDSYWMHVQKEDKERYHGNPLYTLTWYDKDGCKREKFTARGMEGWIDYNGWYYQAKEGGIDMERLKSLDR